MAQLLMPPNSTKILVIGGGPAGSYAATALARGTVYTHGFDVTLFERDIFPRYHIGETILPSCRYFLAFIGAEVLIKNHGFLVKFDELLLRHAAASGVKVFEGVKVTDIKFSDERPVSAIYEIEGNKREEIHFEYLVDASGRTGLLSTKYLKNRRFTNSLRNMALWGYWKGGGRYAQGTDRENAPWTEALTGK
ncbi:hypothetical protein C0992_003120 [Termitomyces sp. T32_za158]|nr:hypothetical protein C0992_003120 [Termitomyces sp. T32_za158]